MKRTPRLTCGRLWAWVYLAIFGTDDDTDEVEAEFPSEADPDGEQGDVPSRGSE